MNEVLFDLALVFSLVYAVVSIINFRMSVAEMEKKAAKERARKAYVSAISGDNISAHRWEKLREKL
tara:strand:+ start:336 stop:533 length:198 start_codon:yes stop_codon:yes gene_type:complete